MADSAPAGTVWPADLAQDQFHNSPMHGIDKVIKDRVPVTGKDALQHRD